MDSKLLQEFMNRTDERLSKIEETVNKLWEFRTLLIGGSIALSAITSLAIGLATVYVTSK